MYLCKYLAPEALALAGDIGEPGSPGKVGRPGFHGQKGKPGDYGRSKFTLTIIRRLNI